MSANAPVAPKEPTSTPTETPDDAGAYPRLTDAQIAVFESCGQRRRAAPRDLLFREGEPTGSFFVVLSGLVAIVEGYGADDERVVNVHGPGRFLGELGLLEGQVTFLTAVVLEPSELLEVPRRELAETLSREPELGDLILRAYLNRRALLLGQGTGFRIIGPEHSPDTRRLLAFAARNRLPHHWIDPEREPRAEALLCGVGVSVEQTPVVLWGRTKVLRNPSNTQLAELIGLRSPAQHAVGDLLIVGAGPAGLAAAVYGASEGLRSTVLDQTATGGQAATSSRIENYLGFPAGISGAQLAERALIQAIRFGARVDVPAAASALERREDGHYAVRLDDGGEVTARAVVVATGARYRRLEVPGAREFEGLGIHYAATVWEARQCGSHQAMVVGGGNSAGQAAVFLARTAGRVFLVIRGDDLGKDMSRYLVDRVEADQRIEVLLRHEVRAVTGEKELEAAVVEDRRTASTRTIPIAALFVFIGVRPGTEWAAGLLALDGRGAVLTGRDAEAAARAAPERWRHLDRAPMVLEASCPGVFAVGDARSGSIKRVASAVGEGAMSVRLVHEYLREVGVQGSAA
ncbi:MAG TPA: FAD-dependent oxidoreductase [Actinospica sp.]|nr:FAD-dependent oxidoreductase [Actinospica sp.]